MHGWPTTNFVFYRSGISEFVFNGAPDDPGIFAPEFDFNCQDVDGLDRQRDYIWLRAHSRNAIGDSEGTILKWRCSEIPAAPGVPPTRVSGTETSITIEWTEGDTVGAVLTGHSVRAQIKGTGNDYEYFTLDNTWQRKFEYPCIKGLEYWISVATISEVGVGDYSKQRCWLR